MNVMSSAGPVVEKVHLVLVTPAWLGRRLRLEGDGQTSNSTNHRMRVMC